MSEYKNYYRILQVDPSAEPEVIVAAYKRLALKYHPDTNKSSEALGRMQEINEAYSILNDPVKRSNYNLLFFQQTRTPNYSNSNQHQGATYAEADAKKREQERIKSQRAQDEQRKRVEVEARKREQEQRDSEYIRYVQKVKANEKTNRQLGCGFLLIYAINTFILFQVAASWINSFWMVLLVLVVAGLVTLPITFKLDDFLRK